MRGLSGFLFQNTIARSLNVGATASNAIHTRTTLQARRGAAELDLRKRGVRMTNVVRPIILLTACLAILSGCAGDDFGLSTGELAPAGSNAAFVGHTIPSTMAAGERVRVTVTVTNTGTTPGTNDWTANQYYIYRQGSGWGWVNTAVTSTVTTGSNTTFSFVVTAPSAPGGYTLAVQMFSGVPGQTGFFGPVLSVPVTVSATTPHYACAYEPGSSSVPTTVPPGSNTSVTVAVRNTGTDPWSAGSFYLYSRNSPITQWGVVNVLLTSAVAPGAVGTFTFTIRAPSTSGATPFNWDMFQAGGVGLFGSNCVNLSITIGGSPALDSLVGASSFPSTMAPSEGQPVTLTFQNTGTQTWTSGTAFAIYSTANPTNLFGTTISYLGTDVAPGASGTFSFPITAPASAGTYTASYRMRKLSGTDAGFFGATFSTPIVVDAASPPAYSSTEVSHSFPARMTVGSTAGATVELTNSGTSSWVGSNFFLESTSSPIGFWGVTSVPLGSGETIAPGASRTFALTLHAPTTVGTYPTSWRMRGSGIGSFGATASGTIETTLCGNTVVDAGEQCDDGNLADSDGCSSMCQFEVPAPMTLDLAAASGGRTLIGTGTSHLSSVTVGDVTDDGVPDVMVSQLTAPGVPRSTCGVVYGFVGGTGFFTSSSDTVPSDAGFAIVGAEAGDQLGTYITGSLVVGDMTGDGVDDIIVSAPNADGPSNSRTDAGDVYIISGSLALASAGTIDLGAMTPPSQLAATIYGALVGDQTSVLAVADLTGDGINDLVLGAPQTGNSGSRIGVIYIVVGTASGLSGTLDLLAPGGTTIIRIDGAATGDRLGLRAAIGDFTGDSTLDLLVGTPGHTVHATQDGAAWAFAGPLSSDRSIAATVGSASGPDIAWFGVNNYDNLGSGVATGNVRGTARADVAIGMLQYQRTPGVQVGGVAVFDGPVAPGTYDLSVDTSAVTALIMGVDQYDNLGTTVRVADVSGDGTLDIIASAPSADGPTNTRTNAGEIAVIRGGPTLVGTIDLSVTGAALTVYGATSPGLIGSYRNTLSAGDVDGDGLADFCFGSELAGSGAGRVDCIRSPL